MLRDHGLIRAALRKCSDSELSQLALLASEVRATEVGAETTGLGLWLEMAYRWECRRRTRRPFDFPLPESVITDDQTKNAIDELLGLRLDHGRDPSSAATLAFLREIENYLRGYDSIPSEMPNPLAQNHAGKAISNSNERR